MAGLSQEWVASITVFITALPAVGALLLVRSQAQKRRLDTQEIVAIFLIFWGYLLFASFEEALLLPKTVWYLGWGLPLFVGLIYTAISAYLIYKKY
jgi:uncharacterized membrane protein (DUF485 family)